MLKQTAVRGKERDLGKGMTGVLYEQYATNRVIEGCTPKEKKGKKKKEDPIYLHQQAPMITA